MKVVFLYTELASYTISCFQQLLNANTEIMVYRYPVNNEAPFEFTFPDRLIVKERTESSIEQMKADILNYEPDIIFCSGWKDKVYLKLCYFFKSAGKPVVLCFDNRWSGSFRQMAAGLLSRFFIQLCFSHAWVPGIKQKEFALKLGFDEHRIQTGFYVADTGLFRSLFTIRMNNDEVNNRKRFIYVGRYYSFKGVEDLWNAFIRFSDEHPGWELWCVGSGDISPVHHEKIRHFGFLQPEQLKDIIAEGGIFVLPSRFEPWGVVVQEMAAAGFPLLLSSEVGAAELFLDNGVNGFMFEAGSVNSCYLSMCKFTQLNQSELKRMSERSYLNSMRISSQSWITALYSFLKNNS